MPSGKCHLFCLGLNVLILIEATFHPWKHFSVHYFLGSSFLYRSQFKTSSNTCWCSVMVLPAEGDFMMTSSNGNIFHVTGPLWGESTGVWCFLWFATEQTVEQWFEMPWCSLWRHCNIATSNKPTYGSLVIWKNFHITDMETRQGNTYRKTSNIRAT